MAGIKEKIEKIVNELKKDEALMKKFKENPVALVEEKLGVDLPDDTIEKVVDGVKAAMAADGVAGALGSLKKLF